MTIIPLFSGHHFTIDKFTIMKPDILIQPVFRFLYHILDTYKMYRPDVWYYNGGEKPVKEVNPLISL